MPEADPKPKQFLFVDDDPDCLTTVTALLKQMSKGRWAIRTATNHSQALEQLKAQPVDAVVLDVQMPVMDGIEFLRLLGRIHPGQQVVMLSGRVDETTRRNALELGATMFLEKPTSKEGFQALYAALDSLALAAPDSGFRGVMQNMELQDVLQMECLGRKCSILAVSANERQGRIYVCEGEIIHAQFGRMQGEMALYGLLALRGGQFKLEPFSEPPQRSISGAYEFLLMEAARLRDENGSTPVRRNIVSSGSDAGGLSVETPTTREARGIRIQEVLLSSAAGEVLYDYKCESIEKHLDLFKQLERKTMQAVRGSPGGRFQSVSLESGDSRLVVKLQPGFKLLVRSQIPASVPEHESIAH